MQTAQMRDVDFYKTAGLDPVINMLHWFLCGFEGAILVRNADIFPDPLSAGNAPGDRRLLVLDDVRALQGAAPASRSIPPVRGRSREVMRQAAELGRPADIRQQMLADISGFFSLFSKQQGQRYFEFWNQVLNKRPQACSHVPCLPRADPSSR